MAKISNIRYYPLAPNCRWRCSSRGGYRNFFLVIGDIESYPKILKIVKTIIKILKYHCLCQSFPRTSWLYNAPQKILILYMKFALFRIISHTLKPIFTGITIAVVDSKDTIFCIKALLQVLSCIP